MRLQLCLRPLEYTQRLPTQKCSVLEQYRSSHVLHTFHTGYLHRMYTKREESVTSFCFTLTAVVMMVSSQAPLQNHQTNSNNYTTKLTRPLIIIHPFRTIFSLDIFNAVCSTSFFKPCCLINSFCFLGTGRRTKPWPEVGGGGGNRVGFLTLSCNLRTETGHKHEYSTYGRLQTTGTCKMNITHAPKYHNNCPLTRKILRGHVLKT
jgi:hypothetical protein